MMLGKGSLPQLRRQEPDSSRRGSSSGDLQMNHVYQSCIPCIVQEYDQETKDYEVERHAVFWSDDGCKSLYKNHLECARHIFAHCPPCETGLGPFHAC